MKSLPQLWQIILVGLGGVNVDLASFFLWMEFMVKVIYSSNTLRSSYNLSTALPARLIILMQMKTRTE